MKAGMGAFGSNIHCGFGAGSFKYMKAYEI